MNEMLEREEVLVDERRWQAWKERGRAEDRKRERAARAVFVILAVFCAATMVLITVGR